MHTAVRIVLWGLAILAALLAGLYAYLRRADLSVYETQIERFVSEQVGHKVDFDGLFELQFGNVTHMTADQVVVSNPDWAHAPTIMSLGHFSVSVELWSLIRGPLVIRNLEVEGVDIHLERDEDNRSNWEVAGATEADGAQSEFDAGNVIAFRRVLVQDVRLRLNDPARRRPLELDLEYLTLTPDEINVLDLDLAASINGLPLSANGQLGPWTNLLDGRDVMADLDVSLAESSLVVDGHIDDLFRLEGVETTLTLRGPKIDRVIDALGIPPFAEGEFEVNALVDAEPATTFVRLDGALGEIEILADGSIEKFIEPGEAAFDFDLSGPDAKYVAEVFGIENVTQAPFRMAGSIAMTGRRFSLANVVATFATGKLGVEGWIDLSKPVPDGDLSIDSAGPDLSAIGAFSGIPGIPAASFEWRGQVQKQGQNWRFDNFNIRIGANRLQVSGEIDTENTAADRIDVHATGPDISVLQELTGLEGIPARPFDVSARLQAHAAGLRLEDAVGIFGDNRIEVDGVLGLRDGLSGTDLSLQFSGPELQNVALLTGVPYLPTGPFELAGRALIDDDELTLEDATVAVTGVDAAVAGTVGLAPAGDTFDLELSAGGDDLAGLAEFATIEQFGGQAFEIDARIARNGDEFTLDPINATVGTLRANLDGNLAADGSTFDIRLRVAAPDAEVLEELQIFGELPPGPVVVAGRVERFADDLQFRDTEFRIGEYRLSADGTLSNSPLSNDSDLRFGASGPDLGQLGRAFGFANWPTKTYSVAGEVNGIPTGFAIEDLVARIGENDIVAQFKANLVDKPEISGRISSTYIDLESELIQASLDDDESAEPDPEREFLFADAPLGNDWLNAANVDIVVTAERAILRSADVHDIHVRLRLWDGRLDIEPLEFQDMDGSVSARLHVAPLGEGVSLDAAVDVEDMHLGFRVSPQQERSNVPPLTGRFELSGKGDSLHEIFAAANGRVDFRRGAGQIRSSAFRQFFGDLVTEVIRTINPLSATQTHTELECAIFKIDVTDGLATIENFAVQSDRLTIIASGNVNFANERIDISVRSKPREGFGISLGGVVNSFLKLGGTLQNPGLNIDAASSVTTTGAAVATGGLSLVARGLWDRVTAQADLCAELGEDPN